MTSRRRFWVRICAMGILLLMLGSFWGCKEEEVPGDTTTGPAESTTLPVQDTTGATETTGAQSQLYWVFAQGGLRIRSGPSVEYEMVGSLEDGDVIEVITWKDGWAYIEEPVKGWCSGEYIHELGWYNDVKTPEGTPPQDNSLKGKWVHVTTPVEENGVWTCRAGIYRLHSNGTFIHSVADYQKNAEGKWEAAALNTDEPYWVGEYSFEGKTLELRYMAELTEEYDAAAGRTENREWVAWEYTLTMDVTKNGQTLTIANGADIPLTVANEHAGATENTLYKASNSVGTPADVCGVLNEWYK